MIKKVLYLAEKYSLIILGMILFVVFFWIIGTFTAATTIEEDVNEAVKDFNEGWVVSYDDVTKKLENIPAKQNVRRGQVYVIKNTLPEDVSAGMTLTLNATRQTGKVIVDRKVVAHINNNAGELFDKYPISKVHYIPLQKEYAGKEIAIELISYSVEYSGRVNEMYYGSYGECIKADFIARAPIAALYLFILFVGMVLVILFFFIRGQKSNYLEMLLLGMTTVILVLGVICEYNMLQSYLKSDIEISNVGFVCKLVLPFVYLGYIYVLSHSVKTKRIFKTLAVFFLLLCSLSMFSHLAGIYDIGLWMNCYTVCTILMYAFSIILIIIEICVEYNYSKVPLFLALHILMFTILVEIFLYFQNVMSYRNFGVFLGAGIICSLSIMGLVSTNNIIKAFEENRKIREELLEKRINLMLRQIQPHFVYNTLNSIQALIEIDSQKAAKMINDFSRYLRTHVDTIESEGLVSFAEELAHIQTYVDIEMVRFPKIRVVYEMEESDFLLPVLTVQPLVENAIRHGVSKKKTGGTVLIKTFKTATTYVIVVSDDGVGFEKGEKNGEDKADRQSVGIKNITYRLNKLVNATLACKSSPAKGTEVRIDIPIRGGKRYESNDSR